MLKIKTIRTYITVLEKRKSCTVIDKSTNQSTLRSKMVKARKYVLAKHFQGEPKKTDLKIVEEELPPIKDGGENPCFYN